MHKFILTTFHDIYIYITILTFTSVYPHRVLSIPAVAMSLDMIRPIGNWGAIASPIFFHTRKQVKFSTSKISRLQGILYHNGGCDRNLKKGMHCFIGNINMGEICLSFGALCMNCRKFMVILKNGGAVHPC